MAKLLDLPNELLHEILAYLYEPCGSTPASTKTGLLRTSKRLASVASPLFRATMTLNVASLLRFPQPPSKIPHAELEPAPYHSSTIAAQRLHDMLSHHLRNLSITLNGVEQVTGRGIRSYRTAYNNSVYVCIHDEVDRYLSYARLTQSLGCSLHLVCQLMPFWSRLRRIDLTARCSSPTCLSAWAREGQAFLPQECIADFLRSVSLCKSLEEFKLDTSDAEETAWTVAQGIGPSCAQHVCLDIARIIRECSSLRRLEVRRRDMCPGMLDMSKFTEDGVSGFTLPKLETVIINLRLNTTQRTSNDTWEALSRDCKCCCWCMPCMREHHCRRGENEEEEGVRVRGNLTKRMAVAASDLANLSPRAKRFEIWSYGRPDKELLNDLREPVVARWQMDESASMLR